ncbi:hypothetical protein [Microbacterium laevaniformans]|uniref:hypothetical protein n=1 Tax=Microbacterium laevaniformans TaxID=36807 RepID=UPI003CD07E82
MSSFASFAMSVVAIVIVMNAVNFIDGLDGLVAGVALISNAVFFVYSYLVARDTGASSYSSLASFIAVALIGVCIGFLPLNWNPSEAVHGRLRSAAARPSHGVVGDRVHGQPAAGAAGRQRRVGRSQLLGAFIPILPAARGRRAAAAARFRHGDRPPDGARQVSLLTRSQAPAPPHARYGTQRP